MGGAICISIYIGFLGFSILMLLTPFTDYIWNMFDPDVTELSNVGKWGFGVAGFTLLFFQLLFTYMCLDDIKDNGRSWSGSSFPILPTAFSDKAKPVKQPPILTSSYNKHKEE